MSGERPGEEGYDTAEFDTTVDAFTMHDADPEGIELGDSDVVKDAYPTAAPAPGAKLGWVVAASAAAVGLVSLILMYLTAVAPSSGRIADLEKQLRDRDDKIAELTEQVTSLGEANSRLESAAAALNKQVESQEGEAQQIEQRQDTLDAKLRRQQDELKKSQDAKKRKKKRRRKKR